ncbi:hypothetical protein [Corallococcus llansteffanensis]|uniref:Ig-like domain-containing protein n=1 Tax=Corallococcus llansteffanensis TaxID=2316731 RepID=A0A3A8PSW7_9BACT|nr:hypothetical protein [Corallococcus llansteffanensis]RKH57991.1 hypothetical protein D7V93_17500 [Corallococcus llansteffanensis]
MRAFLPSSFRALLTAVLLAGCGSTDPVGPTTEEVLRVCDGVSCTAGYCTSEAGVAVCRCGPVDQELQSVCEVDEVGDFDLSPYAEPPELTVPSGPGTGRLHRYDSDLFTFQAVAGRAYRFTCTPEGFLRCDVSLSTPDRGQGHEALVTYTGTSTVFTYQARDAGLHTVRLSAWPTGSSDARGTYQYTLVEVADVEGEPAGHAPTVSTDGTPFTGHLDFRDDVDGFTFAASAGHVYRARCTGQGLEPILELPDAERRWGFRRDTEGWTAVVKLDAGLHLLLVSAPTAAGTSDYRCAIEDLGPDDHGGTWALATQVPAPDPERQLTGVLETTADVDFFAFSARAGHAYELRCDSDDAGFCAFSYIDDASRVTPPRPIVVTEDKVLRVRVSAHGVVVSGDRIHGPYTLTLVDLGADQGTSVADAVPLAVGVSVPVLFAPFRDVDYFRVDVAPGRIYRAAFDPPVPGSFGVFRPSAPDQNLLRYDRGSQVFFKSAQAESLVVSVSGYEGAFFLRVDDVGSDDHADTREAATAVPAPTLRAEGQVDTVSDEDWFALELQPRAHALRIAQSGSFMSYSLFESDGVTPVPPDPFTGDVRPRAAGRHYLRVSSNSPYFDARGTYVWELHPR